MHWTSAVRPTVSASGALGVEDPDLHRAEARLGAHVPPEEGRLLEGLAAEQDVHRLDPVLVVAERPRDAHPRERLEERRAGRREAGVAALPERRVGGQREQQRQVAAHAVEQVDRGVGVRDAHVHVERERGLPARELAHRVVHALVARAGGHPHLLPDRERVRAAGGGAEPERLELRLERAAQVLELGGHPGHVLVRARAQLERRLVGLGRHVGAQLRLERRQHAVDLVRERPRARLEHHDLLLDPERVVGRGALRRPPGPGGQASCRHGRGKRGVASGMPRRGSRTAASARPARSGTPRATARRARSRGRAPRSPPPRRRATSPRRAARDRAGRSPWWWNELTDDVVEAEHARGHARRGQLHRVGDLFRGGGLAVLDGCRRSRPGGAGSACRRWPR